MTGATNADCSECDGLAVLNNGRGQSGKFIPFADRFQDLVEVLDARKVGGRWRRRFLLGHGCRIRQ
jgi:hypothetical protein